MKTNRGNDCSKWLATVFARAVIVAGFLFALLPTAHAVAIPGFGGTNSGPVYYPLNSWPFRDYTNWTSAHGYTPVSFTNLDHSWLGNGNSLVVDSTNQAWQQFNIIEADGATNLTVNQGTVTFWFAPGSWSSTNTGGNGPGQYSRLFEVGAYTPDSSYGLWSLYVDDVGENIYFSAQTNDLSSNVVTYLSAPISWKTNYFHFVALTYSVTNTALYLDGDLATNGPPLTVYPGPNALTNGFFIGSDSFGQNQAHGLFNDLVTYATPLDANTISQTFSYGLMRYLMSPVNTAMFRLSSASSTPSYTTPNIITGQGNLQVVGSIPCVTSTNIWITNVTATVAASGTMNITFGIAGGQDGYYYDVFANSSLSFGASGVPWTWQGQGLHCLKYTLTNMPQGTVFLILGTPQDSDGDGLTDAYEKLVSKTNPDLTDTDGDGTPDGWEVLLGMNPLVNDNASYSSRINYTYDFADWLNQITGIKSGAVTLDNEGNVTQVNQ